MNQSFSVLDGRESLYPCLTACVTDPLSDSKTMWSDTIVFKFWFKNICLLALYVLEYFTSIYRCDEVTMSVSDKIDKKKNG